MAPLLARSLALLALGILLGYASNAIRPDGVSLRDFEAPAACSGGDHPVVPQVECEPEVLESLPPETAGTPTPGCTNCSEAP